MIPPMVEILERHRIERYTMRGNGMIPSDRVEGHYRYINGKLFYFSRVRWADGTVTVRAWIGNTTTVLHHWGAPL